MANSSVLAPARLFELLRALRLPMHDYVIFGSGPLLIRGVIEATNDLDVLCRGPAWEAACHLAAANRIVRWDVELVSLYQGRLTFGTKWAVGDVDTDELIDTAEIIDGLPFARLRHVVTYKEIARRPKDLQHLEALARFELARSV